MNRATRSGLVVTSWKQPARFIAGRRFGPPYSGRLHSSAPRHLSLFPWGANGADGHGSNDVSTRKAEQPRDGSTVTSSRGGQGGEGPSSNVQSPKARSPHYGSAIKRYMRNRRPKGIPPIVIPAWFLERNIKLREDDHPHIEGILELARSDSAKVSREPPTKTGDDFEEQDHNSKQSRGSEGGEQNEATSVQPSRTYRLNHALMGELLASISAGLSVPSSEVVETFLSGKSHLRLHCPLDGGTYFLEKVVEQAALQLQADVIRLDAQDLAEIAGDYIKEGSDASSNALWSLGYDAQQIFPRQPREPPETEEDGAEVEEVESMDEGLDEQPHQAGPSRKPRWTMTTVPLGAFKVEDPSALIGAIKDQFESRGMRGSRPMVPNSGMPSGMMALGQPQPSPAQQRNDFKLGALIEALCESNQLKRVEPLIRGNGEALSNGNEADFKNTGEQSHEANVEGMPHGTALSLVAADHQQEWKSQPPWPLPKTILLIRGFQELKSSHQGRLILEKLEYIVQKKRREGQQVMIIGTTASAELTPELSRSAFETIQGDGQTTPFRTIVVTPDQAGPAGGLYYRDMRRRMREINVRHLHDMIKRLSISSARSVPQDLHEFAMELDYSPDHAALSSMLEDQVFPFNEVHRIALTALGMQAASEGDTEIKQSVLPEHIVTAMRLLEESDGVKGEWAKHEQHLQQKPEDTAKENNSAAQDARLKKIRKTCNSHEKALLRGVVNPENIRTTFSQVHAPSETIDSLKNLTNLSLTRPDAFQYGVLATDKITGLLLYGPPGTGKTLLARAVAKESGATVLEVSGSDVYQMYVGESEKAVRAIFTLAKKLSPCVVFIDEADAIFASRGSATNRNSHKELINQFLREWDGMTDTNAFIMVATNRPFDLDDAALRRLPRRLLVDLPVEKDREAILGIHLSEEQLDSEVSLAKLASQTPLYSGSDLKNLAVAAALTAVREENDAAKKHSETSNESFTYPERRTLTVKHFEKAMEEITASVSDDMSSLGAIRKFDEQYGDRRGRKKKRGGYGFAGGEGVKEDAVKVRS